MQPRRLRPGLWLRICAPCGRYQAMRAQCRLCFDCDRLKRAFCYTAAHKLTAAVNRGELPRIKTLACVDCGAPARHYDHRDYTQPLAVDPTCHSCNLRRGPGLPPGQIQHFVVEGGHAAP